MKRYQPCTDAIFCPHTLNLVRNTKTLSGGHLVYKDAEIYLVEFFSHEVRPTSKYVLVEQINYLRDLHLRQRIDIFRLGGIVCFSDIIIGPPIVEWDGEYPVIVDGIHRFWLAREWDVSVVSIFVDGVDEHFPVIGLPLNWDEVSVYGSLPSEPYLRRNLRPGVKDTSDGLRKYYRDLSYLGSRGRRPSGAQVR